MRNAKDNDFVGRRSAAADAKAALLRAHHAAKEAAEPARLARQEARSAVAAARDGRRAEAARIKLAEGMHAEAAQPQLLADAEVEARETDVNGSIPRVVEDEAARKAERDRRYANRKARQR